MVGTCEPDCRKAFFQSRTDLHAGRGYQGRRIGEWLAARWLAQRLEHADVFDRILGAVASDGVVPTSFRGLVGSLARDAALAPAVLALDPMAVVEYGDVDVLSVAQAKQLLPFPAVRLLQPR